MFWGGYIFNISLAKQHLSPFVHLYVRFRVFNELKYLART